MQPHARTFLIIATLRAQIMARRGSAYFRSTAQANVNCMRSHILLSKGQATADAQSLQQARAMRAKLF